MTYNPAIPQANDIISQSQGQILTNFTVLDSNSVGFGVDHIQFSASADQGKHKKSTYTRIAAPGSVATELVLYQKAAGASSDLFFQRDGVVAETQLTGGGITTAAWCQFDGSNPAILHEQYNVTSVVRNSSGNYTIMFGRIFATTLYCVLISGTLTPGNTSIARAAGSCTITISSGTDSADVCVAFFGTLA